MSAAALILHFLTYVPEARIALLIRYLETAYRIPASTTRNTVSRLCTLGHIERVRRGRYRRPRV